MANWKSTWFANTMIGHFFGSVVANPPGTVWAGLWTQALTAASNGSSAGEVSGGGYARVAIVNNSTNWTAPSGGTVKDATKIDFGTASGAWGTVTNFALLNANAAGSIYYGGTLNASKIIQANDPVSFAANDLVLTES